MPLHPHTHGLIGLRARAAPAAACRADPGHDARASSTCRPAALPRARCSPRAAWQRHARTWFSKKQRAPSCAASIRRTSSIFEHVEALLQPLDFAGKLARRARRRSRRRSGARSGRCLVLCRRRRGVGQGESGCGKSTSAAGRAGISSPPAATSATAGRRNLGLKVQMIFQDPFVRSIRACASPTCRRGAAFARHREARSSTITSMRFFVLRARSGACRAIRTSSPAGSAAASAYARARRRLEFRACDEAVALPDVSIQAKINLFMQLQPRISPHLPSSIVPRIYKVEHLSDWVDHHVPGCIVERRAPRRFAGRTTRICFKQVLRLDNARPSSSQSWAILPRPPRRLAVTSILAAKCHAAMHGEAPVLREVASGHLAACHLE